MSPIYIATVSGRLPGSGRLYHTFYPPADRWSDVPVSLGVADSGWVVPNPEEAQVGVRRRAGPAGPVGGYDPTRLFLHESRSSDTLTTYLDP